MRSDFAQDTRTRDHLRDVHQEDAYVYSYSDADVEDRIVQLAPQCGTCDVFLHLLGLIDPDEGASSCL